MFRSLKLVPVLLAGCAALATISPASAAFPDHPVHIIVGAAPGGGADTISRMVGAKLSEKWGQPVIVENKVGGDGDVAADYVAHAAPDGYTLMHISNDFTVAPSIRSVLYSPVKDFTGVSMLVSHPDLVVVNPATLPDIKSLQDLIALAKSKPGQLNFGSIGVGSPTYMFMQLFMSRTDTHMVNVSYRSMGPAIIGLLGGEVQTAFAGPTDVIEQANAGKVKILAVSSKVRIPVIQDVPTIEEAAHINFDEGAFNGFIAPAKVPKDVLNKIRADMAEVINTDDIKKRYISQGYEITTSTPDEFTKFIAGDVDKWAAVLKSIDLKK